jgi:hypothetical protein
VRADHHRPTRTWTFPPLPRPMSWLAGGGGGGAGPPPPPPPHLLPAPKDPPSGGVHLPLRCPQGSIWCPAGAPLCQPPKRGGSGKELGVCIIGSGGGSCLAWLGLWREQERKGQGKQARRRKGGDRDIRSFGRSFVRSARLVSPPPPGPATYAVSLAGWRRRMRRRRTGARGKRKRLACSQPRGRGRGRRRHDS